ncbi:MAG: hypothetical protein PF689_06435 [Deltaproteobacteria bacterium]|jgi:hypothetical protein|nr:hypothetical protein [Deltaproteobacteria bacterium]
MNYRLFLFLFLGLFALFTTGGCTSPRYIRGTKIPDNKKNKEIIGIIEKYRRAMINKDIPTILEVTHPEYYQPKMSNDDTPYDYKGLIKKLKIRFKQLKTVRFDIQYRKIKWSENKIGVEIFIEASFMLEIDKNKEWRKKSDYMRIDLRKHQGRWRIISGL